MIIGAYGVYLMTALGLTVVVITVKHGPGAWVRERWLRRALDAMLGPARSDSMLRCGTCCSAWSGLLVGAIASAATRDPLPALTLWLSAPFAFWLALRVGGSE